MTALTTPAPIGKAPPAATRPDSLPPVIAGEPFERTLKRLTSWACTDAVAGPKGSNVTLDLFRKKLGRIALMVWAAHCVRRSHETGQCFPSRADAVEVVARYFGETLTIDEVATALKKLRRFGLVKDLKKRRRYGGLAHRKIVGENRVRVVWGRVFYAKWCVWLVRVPRDVKKALSTLPGWGGNRSPKPRPARRKKPISRCPPLAQPIPCVKESSHPRNPSPTTPGRELMLDASHQALGANARSSEEELQTADNPTAALPPPEAAADSVSRTKNPAADSWNDLAKLALAANFRRIHGALLIMPGADFAKLAALTGLSTRDLFDELGRAMKDRQVRWAKVGGRKCWWLIERNADATPSSAPTDKATSTEAP
jgi:hypothetical protein